MSTDNRIFSLFPSLFPFLLCFLLLSSSVQAANQRRALRSPVVPSLLHAHSILTNNKYFGSTHDKTNNNALVVNITRQKCKDETSLLRNTAPRRPAHTEISSGTLSGTQVQQELRNRNSGTQELRYNRNSGTGTQEQNIIWNSGTGTQEQELRNRNSNVLPR